MFSRILRAATKSSLMTRAIAPRAQRRRETWASSNGAQVTDRRIPLRMRKRIRVDEATDCWIWTGGRTSSGYGSVSRHGRNTTAHRAVYEVAHGQVPDGLVIDHLCRNLLCCRPDHLEVVTNQENVRRGDAAWINGERQRSKSHCLQGHPLSSGNLYTTPNGTRQCRTCKRERNRRYSNGRRAKAA